MEDPEKDALEFKKLALEIADLERSWWKRPAYVLAALPTMLAFGTLLVGVLSGYFQAAYTKLENQKHDLEAQVKDFGTRRDTLQRENVALKETNEQMQKQIEMSRQITDTQQGIVKSQKEQIQVCEKLLGVDHPR